MEMRVRVILFTLLLFGFSILTQIPPMQRVQGVEVVLQQQELPIYQIVSPFVEPANVSAWAETLFGLAGEVITEGENFVLRQGNQTFEMGRETGFMWYADHSKLWNVSYDPVLPSLESCRGIADDFLRTYTLLPQNLTFLGYGSSNATGYNPETQEIKSKLLNIKVNYGFEMNGLPVVGPYGRISLFIGDGGDIIGFNWAYQELQQQEFAPSLDFQSALEIADADDYESETHTLVYYWNDDANGFLQPFYEVTLTGHDGDYEYSSLRYIPATTFNPTVQIVSPAPDSVFFEGDPITFNCTVQYGSPPYSFLWEDELPGQTAALSTAQSFTTTSLLPPAKNETVLSHVISVTVTDTSGQEFSASITVTISTRQPPIPWIGIEYVAILVLAFIGSAALLSRRRKGKAIAVLLMALFIVSFSLLPMHTIQPRAARNVRAPIDDYDDGVREVGVEWLTYPGGNYIPNSDDLAKRFYNKIGGYSAWNKDFIWGNWAAWEQDFKYQAIGGIDHLYIDTVDIAMFSGHGGTSGFQFMSNYDDTWLHFSEARWGDGDLEWIGLDACKCLRHTSSNEVWRWGVALQGVHMICGFHTDANDCKDRGEKWANYMQTMTVKSAWFKAGKNSAGSGVWAAVLYPTKAADPWHPPLDCPSNDRLHGFGYVSSEPVPAQWWVWIAVQC
jgi:hypothetical protein